MSLLEVLVPKACATCGTPGRAPLCSRCEKDVPWILPPVCDHCGAPRRKRTRRCIECYGRDFAFARARAAALYRGPAKDSLIAFKLLGDRRSATALARPMASAARTLKTARLTDAALAHVVTFVPATRRSESARGFNPAAALAGPLARALRIPLRRLLAKIRETPDASGLGRDERRQALTAAFECRRRPPHSVLLVDDILTTGATAHECARTLREAGAETVNVVVFARVVSD